jgi:hypothetical protein
MLGVYILIQIVDIILICGQFKRIVSTNLVQYLQMTIPIHDEQ